MFTAITVVSAPAWAQPAKSPAPKADIAGLHIPQGKTVNFDYPMTDGGGFSWQISYNGSVNNAGNSAYGNGMQMQVNNSGSGSSKGWVNAAGDEIETGPITFGSGIQVHRRIKVYKDASLARWLEIIQNTGGAEATVAVRLSTYFNWGVSRWSSNTGDSAFGEKDSMLLTEINSGGNNIPSVLHYISDVKAKQRPRVNINSNQLTYEYSVNVPAGGYLVLCHFESQSPADTLAKTMQTFKHAKYLKDLSPGVRKMIANLYLPSGPQDIELERCETADSILLKNGDPIFGKVLNESFVLETLFAKLTLPASKVIGMVPALGDDDSVRFVMADGQVISGKCGDMKLKLVLPTGGDLLIPLARIRNWSYRLCEEKPEEAVIGDPLVVLRTGDQLAFDPNVTKLQLRTRNGIIDLVPSNLLAVTMDNPGNGVHRAHFVNGSKLGGMLEPEAVSLALSLGHKLDVQRDMITRIRFGAEEKIDDLLTLAVLSNDDQLYGAVTDASLTLVSEFNSVPLKPQTIKSLKFADGAAAVQFWDSTVLRGRLEQEELTFQITPGPSLRIPVGQIVSLQRKSVLPPDEMIRKVETLVARLGAESFKDRQAATEDLVKMGLEIAPLLQKHQANSDPEVRQRIDDILEKIGAKKTAPANPGGRFRGGFMING